MYVEGNAVTYVSQEGSDITGDGTFLNPFQTLSVAPWVWGFQMKLSGMNVIMFGGVYISQGNSDLSYSNLFRSHHLMALWLLLICQALIHPSQSTTNDQTRRHLSKLTIYSKRESHCTHCKWA